MANDDKILVRYVRNADGSAATEILTFPDDRPDLEIGKAGYMSQEEMSRAASYGIVLEVISESDAEEQGVEVVDSGPEDQETPLRELSMDDLKEIADAEGVDASGLRSKNDYVTAIEAKRVEAIEGEGRQSLPATASTGPGETTPGTSGTA